MYLISSVLNGIVSYRPPASDRRLHDFVAIVPVQVRPFCDDEAGTGTTSVQREQSLDSSDARWQPDSGGKTGCQNLREVTINEGFP